MQVFPPGCWQPSTDSDRLMLALVRVLRGVRASGDGAGLDPGSDAVLFTLAHHPDGIRISDVADRLHLDLSTVSRHVASLVDSGYLTKTTDPRDRRACLAIVTDQGNDILQRVMQQRGQVFAEATAAWPHEDTQRLADLLERLAIELSPSSTKEPAHDHQ